MHKKTKVIIAALLIGLINGLWNLGTTSSGKAVEILAWNGNRSTFTYGTIIIVSLVGAWFLTEFVLKNAPALAPYKNSVLCMGVLTLLAAGILYISLMGFMLLVIPIRN